MLSVAVLSDDGPAGERLLVNKRELARQVLNCSLPTLADLIDRYPDFPVEQRGSNGVEWQFDARLVVAFLEDKRDIERRDGEARAALFGQFTLPIDDIAGDESKRLAPSQRLALARTRVVEHKLAREAGLLVTTSDMRQNLTPVIALLMRFVEELPRGMGKRFNLPDEVVAAMADDLDERRREFVAQIEALFQAEPA